MFRPRLNQAVGRGQKQVLALLVKTTPLPAALREVKIDMKRTCFGSTAASVDLAGFPAFEPSDCDKCRDISRPKTAAKEPP